MATIKTGTYRFNDVLTAPAGGVACQLRFLTNFMGYDGVFCTEMQVGEYPELGFYVVSAPEELLEIVHAYGMELPTNLWVYSDGWNSFYGDGVKTVTIAEEQEVSDEFYAWFTANALKNKEISGKWKFNDVLTYAGFNEVAVNFTAAVPFGDVVIIGQCDFLTYGYNLNLRVVSSEPDLSAIGFPLPLVLSVYNPEEDIPWLYDVNYIDFGAEPQSVPADFYNWLTANATELVEISGKWRFREVLTPPADAFKETVSFLNGSESFNAMYAKTIADTTGFGLEFSKITASGGEILLAYADGAYGDLFAVSGWADDACRTVDFGTESQAVSAEFYNWLTGNAVQSNGSLLYRGETIAELFPGQTVTLKCGGMRMEDDVVVRV